MILGYDRTITRSSCVRRAGGAAGLALSAAGGLVSEDMRSGSYSVGNAHRGVPGQPSDRNATEGVPYSVFVGTLRFLPQIRTPFRHGVQSPHVAQFQRLAVPHERHSLEAGVFGVGKLRI